MLDFRMTIRRVALVVVVLIAAIAVWKTAHVVDHRPFPATSKIEGSSHAAVRTPRAEGADRSHLADDLNSPHTDARTDLRIVADVLDAFRTNFPRNGNPVGDNIDITAALTGKNRLGVALIPRDHPAINAAGELCDRWGTPFFFHAESGVRMTVRSAGPDRKMWTADDVVQEP
jgi:hypothetical protein